MCIVVYSFQKWVHKRNQLDATLDSLQQRMHTVPCARVCARGMSTCTYEVRVTGAQGANSMAKFARRSMRSAREFDTAARRAWSAAATSAPSSSPSGVGCTRRLAQRVACPAAPAPHPLSARACCCVGAASSAPAPKRRLAVAVAAIRAVAARLHVLELEAAIDE